MLNRNIFVHNKYLVNGDKGTVIDFTTLDGIDFPKKVKIDRLYDPVVIRMVKI